MLVVHLLILAMLLVVIPYFAGGIFAVVERGRGKMLFRWISGQFLLWVGIEMISAVLIVRKAEQTKTVVLFWCYIAAVLCYSLGAMIRRKVMVGKLSRIAGGKSRQSVLNVVLWSLFFGLVLFQLVRVMLDFDMLQGRVGDFYIDTPISLWVMFLAEISGVDVLKIEQVVLPVVFLCMSYGIFYLLGAKFFVKKREHHPLFMVVVSVLAVAGGYVGRIRWQEKWLQMRSNPEMLMLGSVLIPYLVLLFVMLLRMARKRKSAK